MSKYTLTYRKDRSQEIFIEDVYNEDKRPLYFKQEYDDAINLIKEIIVLQGIGTEKKGEEDGYDGNEKDNKNKKNKKRDIEKYGCNNRVLFVGQRGCGKTSVMQSLAEYLSKHKIVIKTHGDNDDTKVKCCCLPMVDPSHFDNNNNILLTVITSLFSEAKKKMTKDGDKDDTSYREELLKQFEKVFKSLDSIKSELSSYTLESLNRKSDAEDLRDKMNDLVGKYLKYLNAGEDSRLVLLIDDIDMSVSHAPEMLEQLRKYLELDNLIILMSANLGQLSNEMREKYSSAFQYTLKDSNQALSIDVEDLATKYLLKLFPTSRRINVERQVGQLLKTVLIIKEPEKDDITGEFQKIILSQIWSKTRLLFIPKDPENTLHPIIPTNLRDLAQFLDMLASLQDVGSEKKDENGIFVGNVLFASKNDYDRCEHNLQVFKNYVMKTWIPNHLKVDEELVFHNIPTDITEINKHLINSINVIGTKHKDDLMSRQVSLDMIERNAEGVNIDRDIYTMVSPNDPKFVKANKISDIFNQPSNYSYGDLLLMIDKYETYFESEEHRSFTDAIKIYYSILLFETMFFKSQNIDYDYKENRNYSVIPIQKLIGGNVYYPNYFEIITDKNFNQKGPSFDAKRAFYHKVKVKDDDAIQDGTNKVGQNYPLFAVLYYGDIRPDRYEKDHIYDTTFTKNANVDGVNYVTFDILSVFNNMLNPFHTLSRLDEKAIRPEKWDAIIQNIKQWVDSNKIDDGKSVPNAILPFYAVDVMLCYLQNSIPVTDICKSIPKLDNYKEIAEDHKWLFDFELPCQFISGLLFNKGGIKMPTEDNTSIISEEELSQIKTFVSEGNEKESDSVIDSKSELSLQKKESIKALLKNKAIKFLLTGNVEGQLTNQLSKTDIEELKQFILDGNKAGWENKMSEILILNGYRNKIEQLSSSTKELLDMLKSNTQGKGEKITKLLKNIETNVMAFEYGIDDKLIELKECSLKKEYIDEIANNLAVCKAKKETYDISKSVERIEISPYIKELLKEDIQSKTKDDYFNLLYRNTLDEDTIKSLLEKIDECKTNNVFDVLIAKDEAHNTDNERDRKTIIDYLKVIIAAHSCYKQLSAGCSLEDRVETISIADVYRNRVNALILGLDRKTFSKKEKEGLIKELRDFSSVSELYKHLIEVLWENKIKEICIRGKIQEKVHSFEVVCSYYKALWKMTCNLFELIDVKPISIYKDLFARAEQLFLRQ